MKIVFASRNRGKIREVQAILADLPMEILSLEDYGKLPEIEENGTTFFENALQKAKTASALTGEMALADDSGLEVDYLDGQPGVHSARYAGRDATDAGNIKKLLENLKDIAPDERGAAFVCCLVLCTPEGRFTSFDGRWRGRIHDKPLGEGGFGYDPVFFLPEFGLTVAQLPEDIKNRISHRARALEELKKSLQRATFPEQGTSSDGA